MIIPMSKVIVLIYHKALDPLLQELRNLGVVHIDMHAAVDDPAMSEKAVLIARANIFLKFTAHENPAQQMSQENIHEILEQFEARARKKDDLRALISSLTGLIKKHEPWGECDIDRIAELHRAGIDCRLLTVPKKKFIPHQWESYFYTVLDSSSYYHRILLFDISRSFNAEMHAAEEHPVPEERSSVMKKKIVAAQSEIHDINRELTGFSRYRDAVQAFQNSLINSLNFERVRSNLPIRVEGKIIILNGWIPSNKKDILVNALTNFDVAFHVSRPEPGDAVPVLLSNNRFARLFEPITRLFDLPHYRELDLTPMFAPFFVLFFGMCLADAGYGLIIFLLSLFLKKKLNKKFAGLCVMGQIIGIVTCAVGIVTGTFFGIDTSRTAVGGNLVLFSQEQMFYIALGIGLFQVVFGMVLRAWNQMRQFGFLSSLATIGWIMMIAGGLLKFTLHIGAGMFLVWGGVVLILFFNDLRSNIFLRFGKGLWELYGITGLFGDVLSYIRLFALGISSSILGFVVNDIAMQMKAIPWVGYILAFAILIIGHTGNLLVSSIGSFVHPLRLTFVEFYKNAGFQGGGKAYHPLGGTFKG